MGIRKIMPHLIWRFPVESEILNLETLYKWVLKTVYNQLLLNGHLFKADTWSWSLPCVSHLLHLPPWWTPL